MTRRADTPDQPSRTSRTPRVPAWTYKTGLPTEIGTKLYKTGQTRGADDDQIYQNRVLRSSTVLIPFEQWRGGALLSSVGFENGYIVLASPEQLYLNDAPIARPDLPEGLELGRNLLLFYETRTQLDRYSPATLNLSPATSRTAPLGGQYVARVSNTTSREQNAIREGFTTGTLKGAGIRVYEYASAVELEATRLQLAFLAWRTPGVMELASAAGTADPLLCKELVDRACHEKGLADFARLQEARILNADEVTICPLCLKPITATELASREKQAEGREVHDLTITAANLFHIKELRVGQYNHERYNLGWGHHHCNTVARDWGLQPTLQWMREVIARNDQALPAPAMPGDII